MTSIASLERSFGRPLWGTHAVWMMTLEAWNRANVGNEGETDDTWRGIHFDKLAHLVHLLWNGLWDERRDLVTFRSPYISAPGVHGPGPALIRNSDSAAHVSVLDAIRHIQDALGGNPDVMLFDLRTRTYAGKIQYSVRTGSPTAFLPLHLSDELGPALRPPDQRSANQIRELVQSLTLEEIRALGTHQSQTQTLEAIEYNVFIQLASRFRQEIAFIESKGTLRRYRTSLRKSDIESLEYVVEEISRKSEKNSLHYRTARSKLIIASTTSQVAEVAARRIFQDADVIWSGAVVEWRSKASILRHLLHYLSGLREQFLPSPTPTDPSKISRHDAARSRVQRRASAAIGSLLAVSGVRLQQIAGETHESFDWTAVRNAFDRALDTLPGQTSFRKQYDRWRQKPGR